MAIKYLKSTTLKNKTVLLRVDLNVPVEHGKVGDDFRIQAILPTIKLLQHGGNRIILCSHLGRPGGKPNTEFSLKPVAEHLAELLGYKFTETNHALPGYPVKHLIFYTGDVREEKHQNQLKNISNKDILMLENLRFYPGEEANEAALAKKLALLGDVYVNDAFSVCHRKAASVSAVTKYLPSYCGPLLEAEIKSLTALEKGKHPFALMMGGIKISDKVETLKKLGDRADKILIGGGLASLFFLAKGFDIGLSKVEAEAVKTAWQIEKSFKDRLMLPLDVIVANKNMDKDSIRITTPYEIGKREAILDCGPRTILAYANELKKAKTIVWNGPLGHFEVKPFHTATIALARIVGGLGKRKAYAVVGGGETVDAVRQSGQFEHIDHVSTGGGAMLEFLAGKKLPGIEALKGE